MTSVGTRIHPNLTFNLARNNHLNIALKLKGKFFGEVFTSMLTSSFGNFTSWHKCPSKTMV